MNIFEFVKNGINTICAKYINEKEEIEYLPIFYIAGNTSATTTSRRRSRVDRAVKQGR